MDTYGVLLHCEFYNAIKGTLEAANFLRQISQVMMVFPEGFVGITKFALQFSSIFEDYCFSFSFYHANPGDFIWEIFSLLIPFWHP
jgi:hypothetical protein